MQTQLVKTLPSIFNGEIRTCNFPFYGGSKGFIANKSTHIPKCGFIALSGEHTEKGYELQGIIVDESNTLTCQKLIEKYI